MSERSRSPESGPGRPAPPPSARPRDDAAAGSGREPAAEPAAGSPATGSPTTEAAARIAELEDQRLRALADLDNARKRCASQISRTEAETRARAARLWLPVVDNLELALQHAASDPGSIVEGIRAVRGQALSVLAQLGFARRDDLGTRFDPKRHEAVASRAAPDAPDGSVVEVVRPAYGQKDSPLPPAHVVVPNADS